MDNVSLQRRESGHSIRAAENLLCRTLTTWSVTHAHAEKNRRGFDVVARAAARAGPSPLRRRCELARGVGRSGQRRRFAASRSLTSPATSTSRWRATRRPCRRIPRCCYRLASSRVTTVRSASRRPARTSGCRHDTDVEIPAEAVDGNLVARLVQHSGNVFYDVAPRDVGKLRVETPFLVAVIKGTQFNVAVQDGTARRSHCSRVTSRFARRTIATS